MSAPARLPDLSALSLLVDVARTGSISGAAQARGLTQQAASSRIRAIEAQVGVPLVQRRARGSTLTSQGAVVVEWAARLLDLAEEVEAALATLREDRDRELRISASMTVAEHLLPRWLVELRTQQRRRLRVTTVSLVATNSQQVVAAVTRGDADLGFVEGAEAPIGLASRELGSDELVLVAASHAPVHRSLRPDQVARLPLTSREAGSGTRQIVETALAAHGLTQAEPDVELTTSTAVRETVRAGGAPAFVSRLAVEVDLATGQLRVVATPGLDLRRTFRAVWAGGGPAPAGPIRDLLAIAARSFDRASDGR